MDDTTFDEIKHKLKTDFYNKRRTYNIEYTHWYTFYTQVRQEKIILQIHEYNNLLEAL